MKTPERPRARSLRGRLLGYLLLPLLLLMAAGAWLDHRTLVTPVYAAFDRALARSAGEIAMHVERLPDGRLDIHWPEPPRSYGLPGPPMRPPHFLTPPPHAYRHPRESFLFRVSGKDGATLAGTADLPTAQPGDAGPGFRNAKYRGLPVRVATLRITVGGESLLVSAAETMHWRDHVVRRLDTTLGFSDGLQLVLVLAIAMLGITVALRPLQRLRERIASQPPEALKPLPVESVPGEVQPLVASLNGLLVTVRESAQAQQHFLTNAAHQLRTPLTGLKAQLEVLERESAGGPLQERIAVLHGGIARLARTADQLLALARAEPSAQRPGDFAPLPLPGLVGAVVTTMLDRALARGVDLGADCRPAQAEGVYWLLHELLVNLVDNAIRHAPAGGQVTVRCGTETGVPFLEVEDDGPGIPPAERERVRERFYHGDGQGSGLGLAIVEEIARSHRARLLILDGAAGGARMRVAFPATG
ncbi:sensor histidine kinase N-terminal domain-containing protein [Fulvimonas sp. R45]|uniref:sensor histidine kinase n=1 Tax=Fulvimonas sp. R45 TaxID=3045937 RepID=UPI00265F2FD8|nr:sensor histidine kinase [Fulvimonas sp. R45]MDO1527524.1 sensor histidine kinase N-terminal domain-containing protein [Fulvimonas sp. R45]